MLKLTKSGRVVLFILGLIALLYFKSLFSDILFSFTKWSSKSFSPDQINDIDPRFLLSNSLKDKDPFSKDDFLNKRFIQLVSSSHLAKSTTKLKNNSLDTDFNFSHLLNELIVVVKTKNFFSFLLGCREVALIQVFFFY